jgi:DNA-directed RNA polymerase subunit RPC12/RpoP
MFTLINNIRSQTILYIMDNINCQQCGMHLVIFQRSTVKAIVQGIYRNFPEQKSLHHVHHIILLLKCSHIYIVKESHCIL